MKIPIEISGRHIHLSKKDYFKLFDEPMKIVKELSQEGEFASDKFVELESVGNVRVLGPFRDSSQLEITLTDSWKLKKQIQLRLSGDLDFASKLVIKTRKAQIEVSTIIAMRHLHITDKDAILLNLVNNDVVSVKTFGERSITFHNVVVRVSSKYTSVFHIDVDEGNAAGLKGGETGMVLVK